MKKFCFLFVLLFLVSFVCALSYRNDTASNFWGLDVNQGDYDLDFETLDATDFAGSCLGDWCSVVDVNVGSVIRHADGRSGLYSLDVNCQVGKNCSVLVFNNNPLVMDVNVEMYVIGAADEIEYGFVNVDSNDFEGTTTTALVVNNADWTRQTFDYVNPVLDTNLLRIGFKLTNSTSIRFDDIAIRRKFVDYNLVWSNYTADMNDIYYLKKESTLQSTDSLSKYIFNRNFKSPFKMVGLPTGVTNNYEFGYFVNNSDAGNDVQQFGPQGLEYLRFRVVNQPAIFYSYKERVGDSNVSFAYKKTTNGAGTSPIYYGYVNDANTFVSVGNTDADSSDFNSVISYYVPSGSFRWAIEFYPSGTPANIQTLYVANVSVIRNNSGGFRFGSVPTDCNTLNACNNIDSNFPDDSYSRLYYLVDYYAGGNCNYALNKGYNLSFSPDGNLTEYRNGLYYFRVNQNVASGYYKDINIQVECNHSSYDAKGFYVSGVRLNKFNGSFETNDFNSWKIYGTSGTPSISNATDLNYINATDGNYFAVLSIPANFANGQWINLCTTHPVIPAGETFDFNMQLGCRADGDVSTCLNAGAFVSFHGVITDNPNQAFGVVDTNKLLYNIGNPATRFGMTSKSGTFTNPFSSAAYLCAATIKNTDTSMYYAAKVGIDNVTFSVNYPVTYFGYAKPTTPSGLVFGTYPLSFKLKMDSLTDATSLKLYYSSDQNHRTNLIVNDTNLLDGNDFVCDSYDFSTIRDCNYNWNTSIVLNGIYYLDTNFNNPGKYTDYNFTDTNFVVFNTITPPTITSDVNSNWNLLGDANIHLTCTDYISGVASTKFRVDDDNSSLLNWGAWQTYDKNILMTNFVGRDGNFGLQFYCTNNAGLDSNSSGVLDINFVLLEMDSPPTPTVIVPDSGTFTGFINVSCSAPSWIRSYTYFIDYNTSVADWNNVYNGSAPNYLFDVNYFPADTNIWLRCKISDTDKNSSYYTVGKIVLNSNTGFDSISTPFPSAPTTITSALAPFSVDASDADGVSFCTFEIYKNGAKVLDVNGSGPGTWRTTYTNLVSGDLVYAFAYCQDALVFNSAKIATSTYTVSITPLVTPPGGGGGGPVIVDKKFEVVYDKPSATLYYGRGRIATFRINVKNITDKPIEITTDASGDALNYFVPPANNSNIIQPNTVREIEFDFLVNDDSLKINGGVILKSGSSTYELPLVMIYDEQRDLLSQARNILWFGLDLFFFVLPLWVLIVLPLIVASFVSKNKILKNFMFLLLIIVLFLVFSFEFLSFFGVNL